MLLPNYFCHLIDVCFGDGDIKCPGCNKKWDVEWDTEYGQPLTTVQEVSCPDCGREFLMNVMLNSPTYKVVNE